MREKRISWKASDGMACTHLTAPKAADTRILSPDARPTPSVHQKKRKNPKHPTPAFT